MDGWARKVQDEAKKNEGRQMGLKLGHPELVSAVTNHPGL